MQPQRRSYSKSFKALVIQECAQPGASIASVALSHSLNAKLVLKWIRLQTQKTMALQPAFIPLPLQLAGANSQAVSSTRRLQLDRRGIYIKHSYNARSWVCTARFEASRTTRLDHASKKSEDWSPFHQQLGGKCQSTA